MVIYINSKPLKNCFDIMERTTFRLSLLYHKNQKIPCCRDCLAYNLSTERKERRESTNYALKVISNGKHNGKDNRARRQPLDFSILSYHNTYVNTKTRFRHLLYSILPQTRWLHRRRSRFCTESPLIRRFCPSLSALWRP